MPDERGDVSIRADPRYREVDHTCEESYSIFKVMSSDVHHVRVVLELKERDRSIESVDDENEERNDHSRSQRQEIVSSH